MKCIMDYNNIEQTNLLKGMEPYQEDTKLVDGISQEDFEESLPDNNNEGAGKSSSASSSERERHKDPQLKALSTFGTDLTRLAQMGKLDPMIGREQEVERLIQILCRLKKSNPVLIGEPGVGKSAIVEGLAQRIHDRTTPHILHDKRIISLDTALLVAGTSYRGQFEERLKSVVKELKEHPEIILFIDEIHTIIGAGSTQGSMDMANILKPALSRGEIRCIGATTLAEYSKSIEKDGALERRFQKIIVNPTTPEETLNILRNIKGIYEKYHRVHYTDEALQSAVELTDRYISDRYFPDKAIDAIDEAGARMHANNSEPSEKAKELEERCQYYKEQRIAAVKASNYELAASWREKERDMLARMEQLSSEDGEKGSESTITSDHIAQTVALITGVPAERIAKAETERLKALKDTLSSIVIGQDEAIDKVSRAIQRNRLGLRNEKRPIGSFLFLGSTGIGKTFLAKKLAEQLFGDEDALIRLDMSEYSEKFTTSRLVGAPPGYVGYEEGGQLTEKVRRKPYSVVLLDEVEKAHPEVFNMLLQVLDEGALTDSLGRKVDFKNTVIIMTGNVGSRRVSEFRSALGFRAESEMTPESASEYTQNIIDKELKRTFSPEFLNRLDAVIHFSHLSEEALLRIVENELAVLQQRVAREHYNFEISMEAKRWLAKKGFDPLYGVRPLKRLLQTEIEDKFTDLILDGAISQGDCVEFVLEDGSLKAKVPSRQEVLEPVEVTQ